MASTQSPERETDEPLAMRWSIGRVAAIITGLTIVIFWAWVFSGAPARTNPDRLADREYAASLEDRCQQLRNDIRVLPNAVTLDDLDQRLDILTQANGLVAIFIDDVEAGAPTTGDANKTVTGWIADWRTYLANREDYARRLQTDPDARLLLDLSPLGDSVDKTIEVFADVNMIEVCATPGDVG